MLTTEAILAMQPGAKLNRAIHGLALGRIGRPRPYSTSANEALALLELLPLFCARVSVNTEGYDQNKPYIAGTLAWHPTLGTYWTLDRVKCATLPIAICKAALLYTVKPKDTPANPTVPPGIPRLGTPVAPPPLDPMPQRTMSFRPPPNAPTAIAPSVAPSS